MKLIHYMVLIGCVVSVLLALTLLMPDTVTEQGNMETNTFMSFMQGLLGISTPDEPVQASSKSVVKKKYTPTTEQTEYSDGTGNIVAYVGQVYADSQGTKLSELGSWKDCEFCDLLQLKINMDPNYPLDIIDYSGTNITVCLNATDEKYKLDIPITVYQKDNESDKVKDIKIKFKNKYDRECMVLPFGMDKQLKFGFNSTTVSINITTGGDDGEEASNTVVTLDGPSGSSDAPGEWIAVLFRGITIPGGSTILNAEMDMRISFSTLDEPLHSVWAEDIQTPSNFSESNGNISGRTRTTSRYLWNNSQMGCISNDWISQCGAGTYPNVTLVIQELVNSYTYTNGEMAFFFNGSTSTRDLGVLFYENIGTGNTFILNITYTSAETGPCTQTPTPTSLTNISQTNDSINLGWTNVAATKYLIFRNGTNVVNDTGTPYNNTGLTADTAYYYSLKAYNVSCTNPLSNYSNNISVRTSASPVASGTLSVSLTTPTGNSNHTQASFKEYTARVTCTGGSCGNVNLTLDPISHDYTIDGDTVYVDVAGKGYISQTPHTVTDTINKPVLNFTNNFGETLCLDAAFGFSTDKAKPSKAEFWKLNMSHELVVPEYDTETVERHIDCAGTYLTNYGILPNNTAWCLDKTCLDNGFPEGYCYWEHEYTHYLTNASGARLFYDIYEQIGSHIEYEYYDDWKDISDKFDTVSALGKTWYVIQDNNLDDGQTVTLRPTINVMPSSSGKYDVILKRCEDTIQQAIDTDRYVYLDPWYNVSDGRILYLDFENTTNLGRDASGNGFDFTNTNVVSNTTDCVYGNCANFGTKSDDYVLDSINDTYLDDVTTGCIALWHKSAKESAYYESVIFGKIADSTHEVYTWHYWESGGPSSALHMYNWVTPTWEPYQELGYVPSNKWEHFMWCNNVTGRYVYRNNTLSDFDSGFSLFFGSIDNTNLQFGNSGDDSVKNKPFNGLMDEIMIYDRMLTEAERAAIYNLDYTEEPPGPAAEANATKLYGIIPIAANWNSSYAFYTNATSNPQSCGAMGDTDTCDITFYVNATGTNGTVHDFYWYTTSSTVAQANSSHFNVTIASEGAPAADSCVWAGGSDWTPDCNCDISVNYNTLPYKTIWTGSGEFVLKANLTTNMSSMQTKASTCKLVKYPGNKLIMKP